MVSDYAQIRRRLQRFSVRALPLDGLRPAAILVPLFQQQGCDLILFTRRTANLSHHRGEISFPGGSWQPGDGDRSETALRETEEEMGIVATDVELLGRLDDCISVHGYHVTPFVGTFPAPYRYTVNGDEIAEVIEVPVAQLLDPAIYHEENWRHRGRLLPVGFYDVGPHQIWGLTAAILRQFLQRVFAEGPPDGPLTL